MPSFIRPSIIAKEAEQSAVKAGEKAGTKAASSGVSGAAMAAVATLPIIGTTLATIFTATSASDIVNTLAENPAALAVLGGLAVLILVK